MQQAPLLFDTDLRQQRLHRAQKLGPWPTFLHQEMISNIAERVSFVARQHTRAVILGDVSSGWPVLATTQEYQALQPAETLGMDAASADLIVCAGLLHSINDLPGFLIQIRQSLQPDGLMVACFPGGDSLQELRTCLLQAEAEMTEGAAQRIHPMIDVRDGGSLLQRAGFAKPVADSDRLTVTYTHPLELLKDLRLLGETSVLIDRPRRLLRRDILARTCDLYVQKYALPSGRIPATFSLITLFGWAPAEHQPKPKPRGSATIHLAQALKQRLQ